MIYEGPMVVQHIREGLARIGEQHGVRTIQDAVGELQADRFTLR
jgi:dihydroorotate dehydrogenase